MLGEREAKEFGERIRSRRRQLGLRQEDVVFGTGVGRRYLIDLEAGKPTAWLGPALAIAKHLGLELIERTDGANAWISDTAPQLANVDLPALEEEDEIDDLKSSTQR